MNAMIIIGYISKTQNGVKYGQKGLDARSGTVVRRVNYTTHIVLLNIEG